MQLLRWLIVLLCLSQPCWGIVLVQSSTGTYAVASSCAVTIKATSAGDLLVGGIGLNAVATTDVTGVADNAGTVNTYVHNTSADATGTLKASEIWYKANCNAGGTTVTFSLSTPLTGDCFVYEFSGVSYNSPVDVSSGVISATTASPENGAAMIPLNSADVLVVELMPETTVTSIGGSWKGLFGTAHNGWAYIIPASAANQTPAFSGDSHTASNYCSAGTAFRPYVVLPSANLLGVGGML